MKPWEENYSSGAEPWNEDYGPQPETSLARRAGDVGISALKSAIGVPEFAVGLADIATGGRAGKVAEDIGFRPKEARDFLDTFLSPAQQEANRAVSEAKGFLPTVGAALQNPSTIAHTAIESLGPMGAGGVIGRQLVKGATKMSPLAAGAVGEGVVSGGLAAEQVRQETPDGLLSPKQAIAAGASGAGTAFLGAAGGKLAQKLGISDIDTLLAGGAAGKSGKGFFRRLAEGGITEGVFEELPQSMQEQMLQNYALNKPIMEGVPESGAMGMLAGGVMGGIAGGLFRRGQQDEPAVPSQDPVADPVMPMAPAKLPDTGPVSRAVNVGVDSGAAMVAPSRIFAFTEQGAQTRAAFLTKNGQPSVVIPHPDRPYRFAVVDAPVEQMPRAEHEITTGPATQEEMLSRIRTDARRVTFDAAEQQVEQQRTQELDAIAAIDQATGRPEVEAAPTAMQIALEQAEARRREQEARESEEARQASEKAQREAEQARIEAQRPQADELPMLERLLRKEPLTDAERQRVLNRGYARIRDDGTLTPTKQGFVARNRLSRGARQKPITTKSVLPTIDTAAHEAATSPLNSLPQPTEAQKESGSYKKGHVKVGGLDISIENPAGSERRGADPDGQPWAVTMQAHYGYIRRTEGRDGDQVDVYIVEGTPADWSGTVYVVDQVDPATGRFDEHKTVIGSVSQDEAVRIYDAHFSDGSGPRRRVAVTPMAMDAFREWMKSGDTKQPVAKPTSQALEPVQDVPKLPGSPVSDIPLPQIRKYAKSVNRQIRTKAEAEIARREDLREAGRQKSEAERRLYNSPSRKFLRAVDELGGVRTGGTLGGAGDVLGERNARNIGGMAARIFRRDGQGIDQMAVLLKERGWLTEADLNNTDGGVQRVKDMIRAAVDGRLESVLPEDIDAEITRAQMKREIGSELEAAGIQSTKENIEKVDILEVAAELDPVGLERIIVEYAGRPDAEFRAAAQEFVDEHLRRNAENNRDRQEAGGREARAEGTTPAEAAEPTEVSSRPLAARTPRQAEQPTGEYNPSQLEFVYDDVETRPGTTPEQRTAGIAALRALFGRDRRAGASVLGSALWRDFTERKGADLIGQQAGSPEELALAAQVLRDPRFETMRFFFTKGNRIVGHTGITSRLPGIVSFGSDQKMQGILSDVRGMMRSLEADGYWMLHNHPGGASRPSRADESITASIESRLPGLRGHVVIDQDEYSVIPAGKSTTPPQTYRLEPTPRPPAEVPHDALDKIIEGPHQLVEVAKTLQRQDGFSTVITTSSRTRIMAIAEMPEKLLAGKNRLANLRAVARLRRFKNMTGGAGHLFIVSDNPQQFDGLLTMGAVNDVIAFGGDRSRAQVTGSGIDIIKAKNRQRAGPHRAEQTPDMGAIADAVDASVADNYDAGELKSRLDSLQDTLRPMALGGLTRIQLTDIYGRDAPELKRYDRLFADMDAARSNSAQEADRLLAQWRKLKPEVSDQLADMMHEATLAQFDPDTGKVGKGFGLPIIMKNHLQKRYDALPDAAKAIYRKARDSYTQRLSQLFDALARRIERSGTDPESVKLTLDELRARFDEHLSRGPYFPLSRFGEFLLIADRKQPTGADDDLVIMSFESARERDAEAPKMRAKGYVVKSTVTQEYSRDRDGVAGPLAKTMIEAIDKLEFGAKLNLMTDSGKNLGDIKTELLDTLNQALIRGLPELSYRRHFVHRKGRPGFSRDAMRAFADSMLHTTSPRSNTGISWYTRSTASRRELPACRKAM